MSIEKSTYDKALAIPCPRCLAPAGVICEVEDTYEGEQEPLHLERYQVLRDSERHEQKKRNFGLNYTDFRNLPLWLIQRNPVSMVLRPESGGEWYTLIVLCSDGTIWEENHHFGKDTWRQPMPPIPGTAADNSSHSEKTSEPSK